MKDKLYEINVNAQIKQAVELADKRVRKSHFKTTEEYYARWNDVYLNTMNDLCVPFGRILK